MYFFSFNSTSSIDVRILVDYLDSEDYKVSLKNVSKPSFTFCNWNFEAFSHKTSSYLWMIAKWRLKSELNSIYFFRKPSNCLSLLEIISSNSFLFAIFSRERWILYISAFKTNWEEALSIKPNRFDILVISYYNRS